MYIVIVGAGDIGMPLIDIATQSGNEVVVIENDPKRADRVAGEYDCLVLNDDATDHNALMDAGIERADALISTTDRDPINIMVCLLAQEHNVPNIVSVVHDPEHMNVFSQIGINTMENPQELIAEHLYRAVARPAIVDYMRIGEQAEVFEIKVTRNAPIDGKTLIEAADEDLLPDDVLIVAIGHEREDPPTTPRGSTRIEAGDLVTVYSASGLDPGLTGVFGHTEDRR
ncbi:potassium channel family protein [Natronorubrum halophilum]|uniref:potassium channel family protein n=1 Tax=Natronorubrum halophilum TaxID=1702106 RepID=UPI000EF73B16|nr:TrkA family potassium uptake protein [Natronorubrum halophilum]